MPPSHSLKVVVFSVFAFALSACGDSPPGSTPQGPADDADAGRIWTDGGPNGQISEGGLRDAGAESDAGQGAIVDGGAIDGEPDACPEDDQKSAAGVCGCGVPDEDVDGDGYLTCMDCDDGNPLRYAGLSGLCDEPPTDPTPQLVVTGGGPIVAGTDQTLRCVDSAPAQDPDGEAVTWATVWTLNGVDLPETQSDQPDSETTLTMLHGGLGLGTAPMPGDTVRCAMRASAGLLSSAWVDSAQETVRGTAPQILSVTLSPTAAGDALVCEPVIVEPDGDVVAISYVWARIGTASGLDAALGETSSTLSMDLVPRGDEVVCTVTAADADGSDEALSLPAQRGNQPPSFTGVSLHWFTPSSILPGNPFVVQDEATAGKTLYCGAKGYSDPEQDPRAATTYNWYVDGQLVSSDTRTDSSESQLAGAFAKHQTVRCEAVPNDGFEDGTNASAEVVIQNQIPACMQDLPAFGNTSDQDLTCGCRTDLAVFELGLDEDADYVSKRCRFFKYPGDELWREDGSCTIPAAELVPGTVITCEITVTDAEGASNTYWEAEEPAKIEGPASTETWADADQVTLSPSASVTFDRDAVLTCAFPHTATTTAPWGPFYEVYWLLDRAVAPASNLHGPELTQVTVGDLIDAQQQHGYGDALQPGSNVACQVLVSSGVSTSTLYSAKSNQVPLVAVPGSLDKLSASHGSLVSNGETFSCTQRMYDDGSGSQPIATIIEATTADSADSGWYEVVKAAATGTDGSASVTVDDSLAGLWLRCRADADQGAGLTTLATTSPARTVTRPASVQVAVRPAVSSPCDARVCDVHIDDPDALVGASPRSDLSVRWLVDGQEVATASANLSVGSGGAMRSFEMPHGSWPPSAVVSCEATVSKGAAIADAMSMASGTISGVPPQASAVSLPPDAIQGEVVTCAVTSMAKSCDANATLSYTFMLDGAVVQQGASATFDTTGVDATSTLTCAVQANSLHVLGPVVTSASAMDVRPSLWTIDGYESQSRAGYSLAVLGDVDGDGIAEIAIGAPNAAPQGASSSLTSAGKVYVLRGDDSGRPSALADVESGIGGFALLGDSGGWDPQKSICYVPTTWGTAVACNPAAAGNNWDGSNLSAIGDGLGLRVSAPGDIDGDGIVDLAVSAPYALASGQYLAGRTYVVSGSQLSSSANAGTSQSIGTAMLGAGFTVDGAQGVTPSLLYDSGLNQDFTRDGPLTGFGMTTGDFDGDGLPDVAVGAPNAGAGSNGRGYLVYSNSQQGNVFLGDLEDGSSLDGAILDDGSTNQWLSSATTGYMSNIGDFNADGRDDMYVMGLTIGAPSRIVLGADRPTPPVHGPRQDAIDWVLLRDAPDAARVRKVNNGGSLTFGSRGGFLATVQSGRTDAFTRASGAGDVNGDGIDDLVIPWGEQECNVSNVTCGHFDAANLVPIECQTYTCDPGEVPGGQVEIAVHFGSVGGTGQLPNNQLEQGIGGFVVEGLPASANDATGFVAAPLGDINGDGLDDVGVILNPKNFDWPPLEPLADGGSVYSAWKQPARPQLGQVGRVYVIYGRTDTAPATLADLEAGIGGTVIEDVGHALTGLTGGDVDGDGLSDVLYSADNGNGYAAVWFGRDRGDITHKGSSLDETLTGGGQRDVMVAGRGDDVLLGNGGADVLYGGSGDDLIAIGDAAFARIDGGYGTDTLRIDFGNIDLRAHVGLIRGIEGLDLSSAAVHVSLDKRSVVRLSKLSNDLRIRGGADDSVQLSDPGWQDTGIVQVDGEDARAWVNGHARLLLDPAIALLGAPTIVTQQLLVTENTVGSIGQIVAVNPDGSAPVLTVDFGAFSGILRVAGDGQLYADAGGLDFEQTPEIALHVTASDNGFSTSADVTLYLEDVNEPPYFGAGSSAEVPEGSPAGTLVFPSFPRDPDAGDTVSVSITSGNDDGAFAVDSATGLVTVVDGTRLDFETEPVRLLVLQATDASGLTGEATFSIGVLDAQALVQDRNLVFVSQDNNLLDNYPAGANFLFGATLAATQNLSAQTQDNDITIPDPFGNNLSANISSSGLVGIDFSLDVDKGAFDSYLPVQVTLQFPDEVVPGSTVSVTHSFHLSDGASMRTETFGINAALKFDFSNITGAVSGGATDQLNMFTLHNIGPEFYLPSQELHGQKLDLLRPQGVDTTGACFSGSGSGKNCFKKWVEAPLNFHGDDLFSQIFPEATGQTAYQNPNILISEQALGDPFELSLSLEQLMAQLGLPTFGIWWGQFTVPLGKLGYGEGRYDIWSAIWYYDLDTYTVHTLEVQEVIANITFEDGTTYQVPLHDDADGGVGNTDLKIPAGADVDGDGRVAMSIRYEMVAEGAQALMIAHEVDWRSKLLALKADFYGYQYSPPNPNPSGESLLKSHRWGPLRDSASEFRFDNLYVERWPIAGFNTPTFAASLQVAGGP